MKFGRHSTNKHFFEGTIDNVRLYSYDLTVDEVAALYEDSLAASAEKAGTKEK